MCIFYFVRLYKLLCDEFHLGSNFEVKGRKAYVEI